MGPPDEASREKIFTIQLRNTPVSSDVNVAALAARTPAYTGADISAVVRIASMAALEVNTLYLYLCCRFSAFPDHPVSILIVVAKLIVF